MHKYVSGLDLACLILREERALALYRRLKAVPTTLLSRHYRKTFDRLGFFSYRTGSNEPVLVRSEKKVLKGLLEREHLTITQRAWIYGSSHTYVIDDDTLRRSYVPAFSWAVFLDQLPKHAVSQRKLAVVLGCSRETLNRRLKSRHVREAVASRRTYLFAQHRPSTKLWFKTNQGGYLRPWNNEYRSKVPFTLVHRTFFFEKRQLWRAFRDDDKLARSSTPYGRRIHLSPQRGPNSWRVIAARTISRTHKVRNRMPASNRGRSGTPRFFDSKDLHKAVYRTTHQVRIVGGQETRYDSTHLGVTPCRLLRDESGRQTRPFGLRRGSVRQITSRGRLGKAVAAGPAQAGGQLRVSIGSTR